MKCPKCDVEMSPKTFDNVEVDRCFGCGGIYVDKGEMEQLENKKLSALVDIAGKGEKAAIMDDVEAICRRCDNPMFSLRGANDVKFDWCDKCESMFFDRGELAAMDVVIDDD